MNPQFRVRPSDINRLDNGEELRGNKAISLSGLIIQVILSVFAVVPISIAFYAFCVATVQTHRLEMYGWLSLIGTLIFAFICGKCFDQKNTFVVPFFWAVFLRLLSFFIGVWPLVYLYSKLLMGILSVRDLAIVAIAGIVAAIGISVQDIWKSKRDGVPISSILKRFQFNLTTIFLRVPCFYGRFVAGALRSTWWLAKACWWLLNSKLRHKITGGKSVHSVASPKLHHLNDVKCSGNSAWQVAHLSDLHLRPAQNPLLEKNTLKRDLAQEKALLADISSQAAGFESDTVIVVTGDITDTGERRDIIVAKRFLRKLAAIAKVRAVVIIPGNHDVNVFSSFWGHIKVNDCLQKIANFFARGGAYVSNMSSTRLQRFARILSSPGSAFHAPIIVASNQRPQLLTTLAGVGLVYVPTVGTGWHLASNAIGLIQSKGLERAMRLENNILLSHHHLEGFTTTDAPKFSELSAFKYAGMVANGGKAFVSSLASCRERILFCLHGHTHIRRSYELRIPDASNLPVFCAPSSLMSGGDGQPGYQWFISTQSGICLKYREWNGSHYS